MPTFGSIMRNLGLMVHHVRHPDADSEAGTKRELTRSVAEEKVSESVTLRRTTIEELEIRQPEKPA